MAITAARIYETVGPVIRVPGKLDDDATFYKGQLLVWDSGLLSAPTNAANKVPAGVWTGHNLDISGDSYKTESGSKPDSEVMQGLIWVPFTAAAEGDVGAVFYLVDNGDVSKTAGNKTWGVMCKSVDTVGKRVLLDFNHVYGDVS